MKNKEAHTSTRAGRNRTSNSILGSTSKPAAVKNPLAVTLPAVPNSVANKPALKVPAAKRGLTILLKELISTLSHACNEAKTIK